MAGIPQKKFFFFFYCDGCSTDFEYNFYIPVCNFSPLPSAFNNGYSLSPGPADPRPRDSSDPYSATMEHCPSYESHWMSAELLSLSADYIDTLLEDWYPGLGARDGGRTMDSIPYVNRVIPCPYCINGAVILEEDTVERVSIGVV